MATVTQCRSALEQLAATLAGAGPESHRRTLDRTISCRVTDLDVTFSGTLSDGRVSTLTTGPAPKAQIRLSTTSDDLIALTEGRLSATSAWASGRLRVDASLLDLVKIRSLL